MEDLKYEWDRLPESHLAAFFRTGWFHAFYNPQHFLTRQKIIEYLTEINSSVAFNLEEKLLKPFECLYLENIRRIDPLLPFFKNQWGHLLNMSNFLKYQRLRGRGIVKPSILDVGCGAGNHYADYEKCGLLRFLRFTGIDSSAKSIAIFRKFHPEADCKIGNIFAIDFVESSFDIVLVNHVFEHLSPENLSLAVQEVKRVARELIIVNFFNEENIPDHIIRKLDWSHDNVLSRDKMKDIFGNLNIDIIDKYAPYNDQVIGLDQFGYPNKISTWIIRK